ncbi:hypothetical protein NQ315_016511 [Exocentrus adspersus]|uniref:Uncharacterized protein n=1 Tax=Exocentrus adspersus TaxID=1586481 RepID=A0AAV8VZU1_9CUCU|nr:hypothetical protein NQ315_016511 [Exocentrus adspersus]
MFYLMLGASIFALCLWLKFEPGIQEWLMKLEALEFYYGVYVLIVASVIIMIVAFVGCASALQESSLALLVSIIESPEIWKKSNCTFPCFLQTQPLEGPQTDINIPTLLGYLKKRCRTENNDYFYIIKFNKQCTIKITAMSQYSPYYIRIVSGPSCIWDKIGAFSRVRFAEFEPFLGIFSKDCIVLWAYCLVPSPSAILIIFRFTCGVDRVFIRVWVSFECDARDRWHIQDFVNLIPYYVKQESKDIESDIIILCKNFKHE